MVKAGYWTAVEALDRSRKTHQQLLPDGLATKNQYLFTVRESEHGDRVGTMWLAADREAARPSGFIYDLFIDEPYRGKGYGQQAMLALEEKAKALGLRSLALHVFAHNRPARALYEQLGYDVTSLNMAKKLPADPAEAHKNGE